MMEVLPLFFMLPLAARAITVATVTIEEGIATYNQTVTFDFESQLQVIEVPSHNNIVHSKSFFYFSKVNCISCLNTPPGCAG